MPENVATQLMNHFITAEYQVAKPHQGKSNASTDPHRTRPGDAVRSDHFDDGWRGDGAFVFRLDLTQRIAAGPMTM